MAASFIKTLKPEYAGNEHSAIPIVEDEDLKRSVKNTFMDFIDEHTNSHGVFICGSKKLADFVNETLI